MSNISCILGVDPGTEKTGYCFLDEDNTIVDSGVILTPATLFKSVNTRTMAVVDILGALISDIQHLGHKISAAAVEDQFMSKNVMVVKVLSRLVGAINYQIYKLTGLVPILIPPEKAKKSIGFKSSDYKSIENTSKRRKAIHENLVKHVSEFYGKELQDDEAFAIIIAYTLVKDNDLVEINK